MKEININNLNALSSPEVSELVSRIKTPKMYIELREDKYEYVQLGYMRYLADKFYPDWSWEQTSKPDIITLEKEAFVLIHGILEWTQAIKIPKEQGDSYEIKLAKRKGSMSASHPIHKISGAANNIKAANTDTLKKAWNTYLHICDDVYQNEGPVLSRKEALKLEEVLALLPETEEKYKIEILEILTNPIDFSINPRSLDEWIARIKRKAAK